MIFQKGIFRYDEEHGLFVYGCRQITPKLTSENLEDLHHLLEVAVGSLRANHCRVIGDDYQVFGEELLPTYDSAVLIEDVNHVLLQSMPIYVTVDNRVQRTQLYLCDATFALVLVYDYSTYYQMIDWLRDKRRKGEVIKPDDCW